MPFASPFVLRSGAIVHRRRLGGKENLAGAWPEARLRTLLARGANLFLDALENPRLVMRAVQRIRLQDAGRAGHVDLGQPAADDVEADQEETVAAQVRGQGIDDG